MKVNAVEIEDKNIKFVLLENGCFKIDGEIINIKNPYGTLGKVAVKNINDIRYVKTTDVISNYTNGMEDMTVEEYQTKLNQLTTNRVYDEYKEEYNWNTLEDEFEYRKFKELWKPIRVQVQKISDPIEVEVVKTVYDTGNEFIKSCFLNGDSEGFNLFTYNRPEALLNIVSDCFKSLDMEFVKNINYGKTEGEKIWSNSEHSGIRYVVAFGTYIFDKEWDIGSRYPKGTLEDMQKYYDDDKNALEKIIKDKYNKHFGRIDSKNFDFELLLSKLDNALSNCCNIDSKIKTEQYRTKSISKIKECMKMINDNYK